MGRLEIRSWPEFALQAAIGDSTDRIRDFTFVGDGTVLAIAGPGGAAFWDPISNQLDGIEKADSTTCLLAASADGGLIAFATPRGEVFVMRARDEALISMIPTGYPVTSLTFSPDSRYLLIENDCSRDVLTRILGFHLINLKDNTIRPIGTGLMGGLRHVAFSPDSQLRLECGAGKASLVEMETNIELRELHCQARVIWQGCFSPDGRLFATAGGDGTVRLYAATHDGLAEQARERIPSWITEEYRQWLVSRRSW
jgi:WD40 repeat protein